MSHWTDQNTGVEDGEVFRESFVPLNGWFEADLLEAVYKKNEEKGSEGLVVKFNAITGINGDQPEVPADRKISEYFLLGHTSPNVTEEQIGWNLAKVRRLCFAAGVEDRDENGAVTVPAEPAAALTEATARRVMVLLKTSTTPDENGRHDIGINNFKAI